MAKPATFNGDSDRYTLDCERLLVTLWRGLLQELAQEPNERKAKS